MFTMLHISQRSSRVAFFVIFILTIFATCTFVHSHVWRIICSPLLPIRVQKWLKSAGAAQKRPRRRCVQKATSKHHLSLLLGLHYKQKPAAAAANRSAHLCRRGCKCCWEGKQVVRDNGNGYVQGALVLQKTRMYVAREHKKKEKKNDTPGPDTGFLIRPRYWQTCPNPFASSEEVVAKCCWLLCCERTDALWLVASP